MSALLGFLWANWTVLAPVVLATLAVVGIGAFVPGGWLLVARKPVLALLGAAWCVALGVLGLHWWEAKLRAEGAAELRAVNEAARLRRVADNTEYERKVREQREASDKQLATKEKELDEWKRRARHVPPAADAGCRVTRGFVYDHNADVSRAAGRAEIPAPPTDILQPAPGVVLSVLGKCVGDNYTECGKLRERLATCEQARYDACTEWDRRYGTRSNCTRASP